MVKIRITLLANESRGETSGSWRVTQERIFSDDELSHDKTVD